MAFDSERKRIVLFGGQSTNQQLHGDTWEWDGQTWTQQQDVGPSLRRSHSMAYDTKRRRTVLFGGQSQVAPMGDTWEWNGSVWTQVADFGPNASLGSVMAYDGESVLIYGGVSSAPAVPPPAAAEVFGNTWQWDGKHWTQRQDIGPGPRWLHAVAFDSKNGRFVLFGGLASFEPPDQGATSMRRDTWESSEFRGNDNSGTATLASFNFVPSGLVASGTAVTGILTLDRPAPSGGTLVTLESDFADADTPLPLSITIPENASDGQFVFIAPRVAAIGRELKVTATVGGVSKVAAILLMG